MFDFVKRLFWPPEEETINKPGRRPLDHVYVIEHNYPARVRMVPYLNNDVFGYPSGGGLLHKMCSVVELGYLGLDQEFLVAENRDIDRIRAADVPKFDDPVEEDAFCQKMLMIGAKRWRNIEDFWSNLPNMEDLLYVDVGWPEDGHGVWVARWTNHDERMAGFYKLEMATSMDDRCRIIKRSGGIFYDDPTECPELAVVLSTEKVEPEAISF
ncbi:hypothetical protein B0O99DRAFT_689378 [Bisporella sp. PMI_857]|nr:hypothetical protein B0O99DRAFT_689378 [Bisporella sp. PMI_857]